MARRRAEMDDIVVEEVTEAENTQIVTATEPIVGKKVINEKEYSISEDPYLTDEQKQVLFEYELKKILSNLKSEPDRGPLRAVTLLRYVTTEVVEPVTKYVEVYGDKEIIRKGWDLYKYHIKNPTVKDFLERLSAKVSMQYVSADILDLN